MYFFDVTRLKQDLADWGLSEPDSLKYLLAFGVAAGFRFTSYGLDPETSTLIQLVAVALPTLVGPVYCYHRNRGPDGELFVLRFISVGWVVSLRLAAAVLGFLILVVLGASLGVAPWSADSEGTQALTRHWAFILILEVLLYWRIGSHMADLAEQSRQPNQSLHRTPPAAS